MKSTGFFRRCDDGCCFQRKSDAESPPTEEEEAFSAVVEMVPL
jgi:hypothetical protein